MNDTTAANLPRIDAEEMLEGILEWVGIETPSRDGAAVNRLADKAEAALRSIGMSIERIPAASGGYGDTVIGRSPWGGDGPGILILAHLDTVHPHGTIDGPLKVRREGNTVWGPGIYDMKSGSYMAYYALRHLVRLGRTTPLPVTILYVPEEEIGSPSSRPHIERESLKNKYVLVTEPARDGGRCVTSRKGCARYVMTAAGRPAHSGVKHQDGRSAIKELARQILDIEALTDYGRGVTTNVGLWSGGTVTNVVPAHSQIEIDIRLPTMADAEEICAWMEARTAYDPDVTLTLTGGLNRPPYEKTPEIEALLAHAQRITREELGFELNGTYSGGFSDGNFPAALGVPTLDGLGANGGGAHTLDEHLEVSSLEPRTQLLIRMLETLR